MIFLKKRPNHEASQAKFQIPFKFQNQLRFLRFDPDILHLIKHFIKKLIRFFCCPTVKIASLQECQDGTFWCHEFLWPMEWRSNVKKKVKLGSFHVCLVVFCKKCIFYIMNWSNQKKPYTRETYSLKGKNTAPFQYLLN